MTDGSEAKEVKVTKSEIAKQIVRRMARAIPTHEIAWICEGHLEPDDDIDVWADDVYDLVVAILNNPQVPPHMLDK